MDPEIDFEAEPAELDIDAELASLEQPAQPAAKAPGVVSPKVGAAAYVASKAPGVVSLVNKGAKAVAAVDPVVGSLIGSTAPVPGGSAIGAAAPKAAGIIAKATNPATVATRGARGRFVTGSKAAGPVARGAGVIGRMAGAASLPALLLSSLYDVYQGGQAQAAKLDDPSLEQAERDELLRQLHSMGGF